MCVSTYVHVCVSTYVHVCIGRYQVATISRLPKIIGLFCKRALYKRLYSAKETYTFKEPTDHSHHISVLSRVRTRVNMLILSLTHMPLTLLQCAECCEPPS